MKAIPQNSVRLNRFSTQRLKINNLDYYHLSTNWQYPAVKTIFKKTRPVASFDQLSIVEEELWLTKWRDRVGKEKANEIEQKSIYRGKGLHTLIEHYLAPNQVHPKKVEKHKRDKLVIPYWESIQRVLSDIHDAYLVEGAVWHPIEKYAGVTDAIVDFRGNLCICEWKTALKPKREEWITEHFLQVAGYCAAANRVYQNEGIKISKAAIFIALPNQDAQIFEISSHALKSYWELFKIRVHQYYQEESKSKMIKRLY